MSSRLPDTSARRAPENLAILLREPLRVINDVLIERLAATGHEQVRAPHGLVLQYLDDPGSRVGVLAERAGITKQSMAELVAHLEQHGYVERIPDPADGRAKLVRATTRGRAVYAIARDVIDDIEREWTAELGATKMRRLQELLQELNDRLTEAHPQA